VEELETRTLLSAAAGVPAALLHQLARPAVSVASLTDPTSPPYTPAAIRSAYAVDKIKLQGKHGGTVAGDGAGQTIAIVDAFNDPNITGDLAVFDHFFGLPAPPSLTLLNEHGGSDLRNVPNSPQSSWALEESIDVEWAHAIAPAANIVLFEANAPTNIDLDTANESAAQAGVYQFIGLPAAGVISDSWFTPEGPNPATQETQASEQFEDTAFYAPISNAQNVTVLAADGDFGTQGYPAVSPYVLGVGATALTLQKSGKSGVAYSSETAWSPTPDSNSPTGFLGTGGGVSQFEPEASYQLSYGINTGGFRASPDVSMDGSSSTPVDFVDSYDFPNGNPTQEFAFGTSVATPMWAGLLTIVNQGRALLGRGVLANAQEALYEVPASDFHDVTSGSNLLATAGPGYDPVTGIGTPIANALVSDLVHIQTGTVVLPGAAVATVAPPAKALAAAGGAGVEKADAPGASIVAAVGPATRALAANASVAFATRGNPIAKPETPSLTTPPGHDGVASGGSRGDSGPAVTAGIADTSSTESGVAGPAEDGPQAVAEPIAEFVFGSRATPPAAPTRDAVFADLGSELGADLPTTRWDDRPAFLPAGLAGESDHPVDLAMIAGLALALSGLRGPAPRTEEKHPAPRP
jgi:hypothetical protein